ncbi:hypothetical protein XENORESO_020963 [Xenotaenia resolanae]|uniref:Uncharacterized protein n=1 Tax=Xenotaenia resolanae TaxID=208358 RepID=A0ABV0VRT1_9TELE
MTRSSFDGTCCKHQTQHEENYCHWVLVLFMFYDPTSLNWGCRCWGSLIISRIIKWCSSHHIMLRATSKIHEGNGAYCKPLRSFCAAFTCTQTSYIYSFKH